MTSGRWMRHAVRLLLAFVLSWAPAAAASAPGVDTAVLVSQPLAVASARAVMAQRRHAPPRSMAALPMPPLVRIRALAPHDHLKSQPPHQPLYLLYRALLR